jgi:hypothetical protein
MTNQLLGSNMIQDKFWVMQDHIDQHQCAQPMDQKCTSGWGAE